MRQVICEFLFEEIGGPTQKFNLSRYMTRLETSCVHTCFVLFCLTGSRNAHVSRQGGVLSLMSH